MELHNAIKEIVVSKGADMICNPQIINYLQDYQAFKEKPATKLILRDVINAGYGESVLALQNDQGWKIKLKQYQHEFIDSCGYKEELAVYVFESLAFAIGLNMNENQEPEVRSGFNVDSFFDIPEAEVQQPSSSQQYAPKQNADSTDFYTIAQSFFNEGKYQQARSFVEKAIYSQPAPPKIAHMLRLLGDILMMLGNYEDAIKVYNECFNKKAIEGRYAIDILKEYLKQHKIKGYENIMFNYFYCLYGAKRINDSQWMQFVKEEARYGLLDAIKYCADNGINPIEDHFDIYFVDKNLLRNGDYLFDDGSFAHEIGTAKKTVGRIALSSTSVYEQSQGWTHGYIIYKEPLGRGSLMNVLGEIFPVLWSKNSIELPFPHSHYTMDDINHWDEIDRIESEHFISINNYDDYPVFKVVKIMNSIHQVPISGTSGWLLPSIHHFKRIITNNKTIIPYNLPSLNYNYGLIITGLGGDYWTSSQASEKYAISLNSSGFNFGIRGKGNEGYVLPIAAF